MVGGDATTFGRAEPVLSTYARAIRLMGPAGSGQLTKMVNQICIAGILQGLAEGLHFAECVGLDLGAVVDVISKGAAQSRQMEVRSATMAGRELTLPAVAMQRPGMTLRRGTSSRRGCRRRRLSTVHADVQAFGGGHGRRPLNAYAVNVD
jgi:3-hydroxyisobutyrate dehydrogenase